MEEWKEYKIGDVCKIKRGASPRPIQQFLSNKGMPWVKIADATASNSMFLDSTKEYIIEEGVSKSVTVLPGTLIVSNSATPGLPKVIRIKACVHDGWLVISDFKGVLRDFMYYKFVDIRRNLSNQANGSVFQNLKTDIVRDYSINIPSLKTQEKIVSILKSLDDKIEVNRKINENLEQQAQALFKSWFVDFEPFKNGEFVESELGRIPKGWRVGTLDEIGDVVGGSTPSKSKPEFYTDKGIAWLTPKDLSISNNKFTAKGEIDITEEGYKSCSTKLMPKGSVLFSSRAPIGYITIAKNDICTNQGFKSVVPKLAGTAFIYYFLKISTKDIENKATGSTFKEASGALMKSLQLIIAPERILHDFENIMKPLFTQQEVLEDESRRLAELRDTLLPKLMSGELKVNEIEPYLQ